jgi:AraC-like DNA-binding protein
VPYHLLIDFFIKSGDYSLMVNPYLGEGNVQLFNLERGLQARIWNCYFFKDVELYTQQVATDGHPYYTLINFMDTQGVQLINSLDNTPFGKPWDQLFLSAVSDYQLHIQANIRLHCLSISFSKNWLLKTINENPRLNAVGATLQCNKIAMREMMNGDEKKWLGTIIGTVKNTPYKTFYIKSRAIKAISDLFQKLIVRSDLLMSNGQPRDRLMEIEQHLCSNIAAPLPDLKALAQQFHMSESTLKRKFKERYGVNMSAYFSKKKMAYAQKLMTEAGISLKDTATMLGYKNATNFSTILKKYFTIE